MTESEFQEWQRFYETFPFDDYHRFHRPAALIAFRSKGGGDIMDDLNWLQPDPRNDGLGDADIRTMRAFGFIGKGG